MKKRKGGTPLTLAEIEQAKAVYAATGSYRAAGREVGRSPHAIRRLLSKPEARAEMAVIRRTLADRFDDVAVRMLSAVSAEGIAKLDDYKKTLSAAIATDKSLVLKGMPNEILGVRVLLDVASMLRREEREEDDDILRQEQRTITLPAAEPDPPVTPVPEAYSPKPTTAAHPEKPQEPTVRVKYYTPKEVEPDSSQFDVLLHGLVPGK